ncbi:MAG: 30S ribosomal protein S9 [Balneola sp.]|jgi:small subunit ribosomal protein S9|nr:30S ribosomal protein S9 [Balneola sp.]MBO6650290.1 30S ribosomal protein S9 [Balneola sp.]MBO6712124.1 30S ribosomal protein S9 [Balneola sp.]MBO6800318.1 30S ribosomal protein S9 [Balneola sp.]MBO6869668.1 30S ribosomal protein S9 [Balneola sp.]
MAQANYIGRRKTSTARLYIKPGKGEFIVNKLPIEEYLPVKAMQNIATQPMNVTEFEGKYDIKVTVRGGGKSGQAGAISHALARALDGENEEVHDVLKSHGLLTRDDRMVERKKYGQPKARKKFQFSKR